MVLGLAAKPTRARPNLARPTALQADLAIPDCGTPYNIRARTLRGSGYALRTDVPIVCPQHRAADGLADPPRTTEAPP